MVCREIEVEKYKGERERRASYVSYPRKEYISFLP
jgi:hypothetical protein